MSNAEKIWYAYSGKTYDGNLPAFFDAQQIEGLPAFTSRFSELKTEIESFLRKNGKSMESYFNENLVSKSGDWKVLHLIRWGNRSASNLNELPSLMKLLDQIPGVTSAAISRLSEGAEILPHIGDTNAVMRCHFGLNIPAGLPDCGLECGNETREWKNGEWIVFCDAYKHRAWNRRPAPRFVLIVDVLLPEFRNQKNDVCANVLSMLELQKLEQRKSWVKYLPGKIRGMIRRSYKRKILAQFIS